MVDSDGVTLNLCIVVRIWMGYIPTEINTLTIVPPPPPHTLLEHGFLSCQSTGPSTKEDALCCCRFSEKLFKGIDITDLCEMGQNCTVSCLGRVKALPEPAWLQPCSLRRVWEMFNFTAIGTLYLSMPLPIRQKVSCGNYLPFHIDTRTLTWPQKPAPGLLPSILIIREALDSCVRGALGATPDTTLTFMLHFTRKHGRPFQSLVPELRKCRLWLYY